MIKLVAMDLDGTLLDENKKISDKNKEAIEKYSALGVNFVFSTGRINCELTDIRETLPCVNFAIVCNGAYVYRLSDSKEMYSAPLSAPELRKLYEELKDFEGLFEINADGVIYDDEKTLREAAENPDKFGVRNFYWLLLDSRTPVKSLDSFVALRKEPVAKLNVYFTSTELRDSVYEKVKGYPYDITTQNITSLEFNKKGVSKGSALMNLGKALGIDRSEIMAIGDNFNDLPMRDAAGVFVAMKNSRDEVLDISDWVSSSNNESGVALALDKFLSH